MKHVIATTALAAALGIFGAAAAQAGVGDGIASANIGGAPISQVENAQFIFGGQNYCWYDQGWQGPGWYWCGYAFRSGLGWGGGEGFHGWSRSGHGTHTGNFNKGPNRPMIGSHTTPHFNRSSMGSGPKGGHTGHTGPKKP
jgi:hypothetical protein